MHIDTNTDRQMEEHTHTLALSLSLAHTRALYLSLSLPLSHTRTQSFIHIQDMHILNAHIAEHIFRGLHMHSTPHKGMTLTCT